MGSVAKSANRKHATMMMHTRMMRTVAAATYASLTAELSADRKKVEAFLLSLAAKRSSWSEHVLRHKRKRYVRGLEQVRQKMEKEFMLCDTNPNEFTMFYNSMRIDFAKDPMLPANLTM